MTKKDGNWFARHKVLTGFLVLVILGAVAMGAGGKKDTATKVGGTSSSQTDQKKSEKTTFKVGETIAFDEKEVTVVSVEHNWSSGNEYIKPDSGKEYLKVQVQIVNKSDQEASYNTFDWKMQDSNGAVQDVDGTAFTVDGALKSGQLTKGGKVSGFLVFQVPQGDSGLTLRYSPSFWTDKKVEIKL